MKMMKIQALDQVKGGSKSEAEGKWSEWKIVNQRRMSFKVNQPRKAFKKFIVIGHFGSYITFFLQTQVFLLWIYQGCQMLRE